MGFPTDREKIVKKFEYLSDKYHKLSLLFYELSRSLNIELKPMGNSKKKIKEYFRDKLKLDFDKIARLSQTMGDIKIGDLKKDEGK